MPGTYVIPTGTAVERQGKQLAQVIELLTEIRDRLPAPQDTRVRLFGWALGEPDDPTPSDVELARRYLAGDLVTPMNTWVGSRAIEETRAIAQSIVDRAPGGGA